MAVGPSAVEYRSVLETAGLGQGEPASVCTHAQYLRAGRGTQGTRVSENSLSFR